ncbi:Caudovirus prohead protease [compost metagenome]
MSDLFKFFVSADIDVKKSEEEGRRLIQGYASTPAEDRQGESLVQKGLDITDFVEHGYLNYDHDNSIILGYPTVGTHIDERGLWVEGELLKGLPAADQIWELALALKKSNAPRKLGFSVEGKVVERKGSRIVKAKIYHCAITPTPVNTEATWDAVVKSFQPYNNNVSKALEAGYATSPETQTGGSALRKEALECNFHDLASNLENPDFWEKMKTNLANGETVSKSEMVVYLQLSKGMSKQQALDIVNK